MKTIHTFAYCPGTLTPEINFFLVKVGISLQDQQAYSRVKQFARTHNCFLQKHSKETAAFIDMVDKSFGNAHVRRIMVDVRWLATVLRTMPPQFLNDGSHTPLPLT